MLAHKLRLSTTYSGATGKHVATVEVFRLPQPGRRGSSSVAFESDPSTDRGTAVRSAIGYWRGWRGW